MDSRLLALKQEMGLLPKGEGPKQISAGDSPGDTGGRRKGTTPRKTPPGPEARSARPSSWRSSTGWSGRTRTDPFRLPRHLDADAKGFSPNPPDPLEAGADDLEALHGELLGRNGLEGRGDGHRLPPGDPGAAPRTHHFPDPAPVPTVYAYAGVPAPLPGGVEKGYGAITVPDLRWARADLKTVQLLPNVLAQQAARAAGVADALLVRDGLALEGALTQPLRGLRGPGGHPSPLEPDPSGHHPGGGAGRGPGPGLVAVEERPIPLAELELVTELFFTGTTTEVRPTVQRRRRGRWEMVGWAP
jgi:hypothetical protein